MLLPLANKFVQAIDALTELLGKAIAWLTLLMVLLTFGIVVLRYGFNLGWIAMQESVLYFHGLVFMLGAAYTLKHDGHVRVDIFYQKYSPKQKKLASVAAPRTKITKADFTKLKNKKKK